MIIAQRGLGSFWSAVGAGVTGFLGNLLGKKTATLTVPPECMSLDAAGQAQCAQYYAAVSSGQMPAASYSQWVQEQQTMAMVKKYAPYALGAFGIVALVMVLRRPKGGEK